MMEIQIKRSVRDFIQTLIISGIALRGQLRGNDCLGILPWLPRI